MFSAKTRTSPPAAAELFPILIWYRRSKARIKRLPPSISRRTFTPRSSSIPRLPQELVEIIISYLVYDTRTLLACSMTCYSWYIAATPHLHYSLTTYNGAYYPQDRKYQWPSPLKESYKLGLLPFVKRLRIRKTADACAPNWLDSSTLRYLSSLTNLRELRIDYLQVSRFTQSVQKNPGHFAPALRSLSLYEPNGSCHQILYLIGFFPNLQDLSLHHPLPTEKKESAVDPALIPLSTPPLCGELTLVCCEGRRLVEGMIKFFGGLRFRHLHLFQVECATLLLEECAETLEILQLYPTDPYANGDAARSHFNLSKNTSLRALKTDAKFAVAGDAASTFFKAVLSTITSPLSLDFIVVHTESEVGYPIRNDARGPVLVDDISAEIRAQFVRRHPERFKVFREMYSVREFRLVFCACVLERAEKHAAETLERVVEEEGKDGGLDYLRRRPLVVSRACGALWTGVHLESVPEPCLS